METFSALLALCPGNSPVPVNSPYNGQWRGALMFSLICTRMNDWVNNREAGDLRRHRGHYDVNVMVTLWSLRQSCDNSHHVTRGHVPIYVPSRCHFTETVPQRDDMYLNSFQLMAIVEGNSPKRSPFPRTTRTSRSKWHNPRKRRDKLSC